MTRYSTFVFRVFLICGVLLSFTANAFSQTYLFNRADFPIGTYPTGIAVADFNRDGRLDIAIADTEEGSVSILLGKPDGTFAKRIVYTGFTPGAVSTGDLNHDGKLDLVVTNWMSSTVSVLLGNGNGTFGAAANFPTSLNPGSLLLADFNHDGKIDVALTSGANVVSIMLGNGNGTLSPNVDYSLPSGPGNLVAADFNRDGKLDLAIADSWSNDVCVLLGNGDGTFQPVADFPAGQVPVDLVAGDFNGDGFVDLVVSDGPDCGCGYVSVLLGNGDGTFQAPLNINLPGPDGAIVAGDFNHDHKLDFAVVSHQPYSGVIHIYLGNGDGTFQAGLQYSGDAASVMGVGDFNHDGNLDLVVGSFNGNNATTASVLLGSGDGTFGNIYPYATGQITTTLVAADLNGDGLSDLAGFDPYGMTVSVLLNNGKGAFKQGVLYPVGNAGQSGGIVAADFNGDERLDLAVNNFYAGTVSVLLNVGNGAFAKHVDYPTGTYPDSVVAGDFNGDGKLDLIVGIMGGGLAFLAGKGNGTFATPVSVSSGLSPGALVVADFNHDGKLDLASVSGSSLANYVSVLLGNGNGTFAAPVNYTAGTEPVAVVAADLNGDGNIDLAVGSNAGVSVLLGNGNGTFQPSVDYLVAGTPVALAAVDLSGTGKLDLAVSVYSTDPRLAILRGSGNGTFQPFADYYVGSFPGVIAIGDFDKSGTEDVAVANSSYVQTVTVAFSTPVIAMFPSAITFSPETVGTTSSPKLSTISNPGRVATKIASISITGTNAADFHMTTTCGSTLAGSSRCGVSVTFKPTAKGARIALLQIKDSALGQTQTIGLSGKGL